MNNNKTSIDESDEENFKQETIFIHDEVRRRNSLLCVYCGDIATTREHPMPLSTFHCKRDTAKNIFNIRGWKTIPACNTCNELASFTTSKNFAERKKLVLGRFERKYKKQIKSQEWDEKKIKELSGMLRKMVRKSAQFDSFIKERHANLKNPNPIYN